MSLHKSNISKLSVERSLSRMLTNWAARQRPPLGSRANLLQMAGDLQNQRIKGNFSLNGYRDRKAIQAPNEIFTLLYAPHMSIVAAWINF